MSANAEPVMQPGSSGEDIGVRELCAVQTWLRRALELCCHHPTWPAEPIRAAQSVIGLYSTANTPNFLHRKLHFHHHVRKHAGSGGAVEKLTCSRAPVVSSTKMCTGSLNRDDRYGKSWGSSGVTPPEKKARNFFRPDGPSRAWNADTGLVFTHEFLRERWV